MRTLVLGLLCGCNPLFGIQETELVDAPPVIDAPPPPMCPATGQLPRFATELNQVQARNVTAYSIDASQSAAAGLGSDPSTGLTTLVWGPLGEPPAAASLVPTVSTYLYSVRLAPEGNAIFVTTYSSVSYTYETSEYDLLDGVWRQVGKPFQTPGNNSYISTPMSSSPRRFVSPVYNSVDATYDLLEFQYDGQTVAELWRTSLTALGVDYLYGPHLSADGLRLVFYSGIQTGQTGQTGSGPDWGPIIEDYDQVVYYADRPSVDVPFQSKAQIIDTVPSYVTWPYLTEDCGRIYFSALNTVWYLKQAIP